MRTLLRSFSTGTSFFLAVGVRKEECGKEGSQREVGDERERRRKKSRRTPSDGNSRIDVVDLRTVIQQARTKQKKVRDVSTKRGKERRDETRRDESDSRSQRNLRSLLPIHSVHLGLTADTNPTHKRKGSGLDLERRKRRGEEKKVATHVIFSSNFFIAASINATVPKFFFGVANFFLVSSLISACSSLIILMLSRRTSGPSISFPSAFFFSLPWVFERRQTRSVYANRVLMGGRKSS